MFLYDIDPFGELPQPKPLTDEEYNRRLERFSEVTADYKERLTKAFGARKARKFVNSDDHQSFANREAYLELDYETWDALLTAMSDCYCLVSILDAIRFTPKKYRQNWTAETLDAKIEACKFSEETRYQIFREAGLPCEEPESMVRQRKEHEAFERERQERLEQMRRERAIHDAELDRKWAPRIKEFEKQLSECEKKIYALRDEMIAEGIEIVAEVPSAPNLLPV